MKIAVCIAVPLLIQTPPLSRLSHCSGSALQADVYEGGSLLLVEERQVDRAHRSDRRHHRPHHHPAGHRSHPRQFPCAFRRPHLQAIN